MKRGRLATAPDFGWAADSVPRSDHNPHLALPHLLSFNPLDNNKMSGVFSSPTLSVPTVTIETSSSAAELKVRVGRARSSSLVKVETVGEDSQEEGLDQSLYGNVNAEWVNRKGQSAPVLSNVPCTDCHGYRRCMGHSSCPHHCGKDSC